MSRSTVATVTAFGLALAFAPAAMGADATTMTKDGEHVLVVDAPDLFKISEKEIGPRFSSLKGKAIYSNAGKEIGEIEDFVMSRDGNVYAVIDTSKGPIKDLLKFNDGEMMILPIRELRRAVREKVIRDKHQPSAK